MYDRLGTMRKWLISLLVLSLASWVDAGLVTRPTKTCGTTSYVAEVAAGCTTIKSSEIDADINAIITGGVNNIETANINAAGLGTAALANLAVTGAKIADTTIAVGKLSVNASTSAFTSAAVNTGLSFNTVETTVLTLPALVVRGGRIIIFGTGMWDVNTAAPCVYTVRVKRGGVTQATYTKTENTVSRGIIPSPTFIDSPGAGTFTYTITMQTNGAGCGIATDGTNAGTYYALELA